MTKESQENFQKNYLEHTPNMLLDENERDSMYNISMKNPKEQYQKFDYDKIQFKQEKEVTMQLITLFTNLHLLSLKILILKKQFI